jgi:hypothetical protein
VNENDIVRSMGERREKRGCKTIVAAGSADVKETSYDSTVNEISKIGG